MTLKRPVTVAQALRWPAAAKRRKSFCARMGGMREKLTGEEAASDPGSRINRALADWDCDDPRLLDKRHVSKGIRPMKITPKMVGSEARKNPARKPEIKWEMYDQQSKTQRAMVGGVEVLVTPLKNAADARSYDMPDWARAIIEIAPDANHFNVQLPHGSVTDAKNATNVMGAIQFARKDYKPRINPARKPAARNPAPEKRIKTRRIVRIDQKTGQAIGTEFVPIDFDFRAYVGGVQFDFFARTEGAQLIVSERSTGAKVGAVPYTTRSAALNDREAAKKYLSTVIDKVGPDRFKAAVAKAPKIAP